MITAVFFTLINSFSTDPFFVIVVYLGIWSIFKSYPQYGDIGLFWTCLPFYISSISCRSQKYIFCVVTFFFCAFLLPIMYYLWIYQGSGNANFYYAVTLFLNGAQILFLLDFVKARILTELYRSNPNLDELKKNNGSPLELSFE
jgi:phosphatidylinositol glycan class U